MKAIELHDIRFSYGKNKPMVLSGIDMECDKGTVNALIGLNGCGKTTLIKILAGLEKPISGSISYYGKDLNDEPIVIPFNFTNYEIAGLVNFGYTVVSVPDTVTVVLHSVE